MPARPTDTLGELVESHDTHGERFDHEHATVELAGAMIPVACWPGLMIPALAA